MRCTHTKALDDGRKETGDGAECEVHAGVPLKVSIIVLVKDITHIMLTTYVFQSVRQRTTPRQSMPTRDSWRFCPLRRVRHRVRWSSLRYRDDSGRLGMNRATQIARRTDGQPSMRKRIRQLSIFGCLIDDTPYEIKPPKAPATAPAEMKRPIRLAKSCLVYQYESCLSAYGWMRKVAQSEHLEAPTGSLVYLPKDSFHNTSMTPRKLYTHQQGHGLSKERFSYANEETADVHAGGVLRGGHTGSSDRPSEGAKRNCPRGIHGFGKQRSGNRKDNVGDVEAAESERVVFVFIVEYILLETHNLGVSTFGSATVDLADAYRFPRSRYAAR